MWISRSHYRLLLKQLARAEARVDELLRAERHWANMLLRAKQIGAFPLAEKTRAPIEQTTDDNQLISADIDPGELAVQVAEGAKFGYSAKEVENMMRKDRGLPLIT